MKLHAIFSIITIKNFIFLVLLISSHSIDASPKKTSKRIDNSASCETFALNLSEELLSQIKEILNTHLNDVDKVKKEYTAQHGDSYESVFSSFNRNLNSRHKYDALIEKYTNDLPKVFSGVPTSEEYKHYCNERDELRSFIENHTETFDDKLKLIYEAIIDRTDLDDLDKNEGLVVIAIRANYLNFNTEYHLKSEAFLGDNAVIGPTNKSYHFEIIKLPEGQYYWDKIKWNKYSNSHSHGYNSFDFSDDNLTFTVVAGKINFTGEFVTKVISQRGYGDISDRSAMLMQELEKHYPYLLKNYQWQNSISAYDPYLSFYRDEKEKMKGED